MKYLNIIIDYLILSWLGYLVPSLARRRAFELRNHELGSLPACDLWLHVSSEGELEQALPVLKAFLNESRDKNALLLITSPSVEAKAVKLEHEYEHLYLLRLPLITGLFFSSKTIRRLHTPHHLMMVRYDFFPILLLLASKTMTHSVLLNATVKGKKLTPLRCWLLQKVYHHFDTIYWSSQTDLNTLYTSDLQLSVRQLKVADFRHQNIIERQENQSNLKKLGAGFEQFKNHLNGYPIEKRLVLGSLWHDEFNLLQSSIEQLRNLGFFILIAPHQLKGNDVDNIKQNLDEKFIWEDGCDFPCESLVVCMRPGLLCELYPYFGHSYVGGGLTRSVHSLLEPYWSGGFLYCGPRVHRSTEYDYIMSTRPARLSVLGDLSKFSDVLSRKLGLKNVDLSEERNNIRSTYQPKDLFVGDHSNVGPLNA